MKLMKEKSEAFINLMKDEIPKRTAVSQPREETIPSYSQISSIVSRVPAKLYSSNFLQRPLFINSFLYSIMGLAIIFLYIKILILEGRIKVLEEEKQSQTQLS